MYNRISVHTIICTIEYRCSNRWALIGAERVLLQFARLRYSASASVRRGEVLQPAKAAAVRTAAGRVNGRPSKLICSLPFMPTSNARTHAAECSTSSSSPAPPSPQPAPPAPSRSFYLNMKSSTVRHCTPVKNIFMYFHAFVTFR